MRKFLGKVITRLKRYYISVFGVKKIHYSIYGVKLSLDFSKTVDKRIFLNGFEKEIIEYFSKILKKGDVVMDIGANIGIYSLIAGKKIGGKGKVYAFEPAEKAYERLEYHISLNNLQNINAIKSGVSDYTGEAEFNICDDDAYNSLGSSPMKDVIKKETIDLVSIDDYVEENKLEKVDIIKVDTEGAEYLVFKGAQHTINKFKPVLFFEYNPIAIKGFENNTENLITLIKSFDYLLFEFTRGKLIEIKSGDKIEGYDLIALSC